MTVAVIVVAAVLIVIAGGALAQRLLERRDLRRLPYPGRMIEVDGEVIHVVVEGSGPTVLIDSGLGGSSLEWAAVAADLVPDFTVVRYDRPGFAWSPPSGSEPTPVAAAYRIEGLLRTLELPGPWILVGHSMGGLHVRLAASLFPEGVGGLVMVDPSHEDMLDDGKAREQSAKFAAAVRAVVATAPLGTARIVGRLYAKVVGAQAREVLDDNERGLMRTSRKLTLCSVHGLRAVANELSVLPVALEQVADQTKLNPVPAIPLMVITASAPGRSKAESEARATINELHAKQAAVVPLGRQVFAERSGHLVPLDQPELVATCVRETDAAIRSGAWPAPRAAS